MITYHFKNKEQFIEFLKKEANTNCNRMNSVGKRAGEYKKFSGMAYAYNQIANMLENSFFDDTKQFQENKSS